MTKGKTVLSEGGWGRAMAVQPKPIKLSRVTSLISSFHPTFTSNSLSALFLFLSLGGLLYICMNRVKEIEGTSLGDGYFGFKKWVGWQH